MNVFYVFADVVGCVAERNRAVLRSGRWKLAFIRALMSTDRRPKATDSSSGVFNVFVFILNPESRIYIIYHLFIIYHSSLPPPPCPLPKPKPRVAFRLAPRTSRSWQQQDRPLFLCDSVVKNMRGGMRCREGHRKKFLEKPYASPPQTGGFVGFSAKVFLRR